MSRNRTNTPLDHHTAPDNHVENQLSQDAAEKVIYSKKGFLYKRLTRTHEASVVYSLQFDIETPQLYVEKVVDFPMVKMLYELNRDVYEAVHMEQVDEDNARIYLLVKPLFRDAGIPQWYIHIHVHKTVVESQLGQPKRVYFHSRPICGENTPEVVPKEAKPLPLRENTLECTVLNPHKMSVRVWNQLDAHTSVPPFMEHMMGLISFKIFSRFRQFMETHSQGV